MAALLLLVLISLCHAFPIEFAEPSVSYLYDFDASVQIKPGDSAMVVTALLRGDNEVWLPVTSTTRRQVCNIRKIPSVIDTRTRILVDGKPITLPDEDVFKGRFCVGLAHVTFVVVKSSPVSLTANFKMNGREYVLKNNRVARERRYFNHLNMDDDQNPQPRFTETRATVADFNADLAADLKAELEVGKYGSLLLNSQQDLAASVNLSWCAAVISVDADATFVSTMGGATSAGAYIVTLVAAVNDLYRTQLGPGLVLGTVMLRTGSDPYKSLSSTKYQLREVRQQWLSSSVKTDLVHSVSSKKGGGRAWIDGLWDRNLRYAVSYAMKGNLHKWDLLVFAHETAHNFGAHHTANAQAWGYQIDRCPTVCTRGTIMSGCVDCPGYVNNVDLKFHPVVAAYLKSHFKKNVDKFPDLCRTQGSATCGGDANGAKCLFPFTYDGTVYNKCTSVDHDEPWCYTTSADKWGNCHCGPATCGGDAEGAKCKFPFVYDGQTYDACTSVDHDEPWCYTTNEGYWGNCNCGSNAQVASSNANFEALLWDVVMSFM